MARAVKIFGDAAQGSLFFEGLTIPPAPLGGIVVASAHPTLENRIRVVRNDQFQKDGVTPRILFKRMRMSRVRNKQNQKLVQDLGFTHQQVIDYINDEANRKANEIDFKKDGTTVGSGNTINFTGNVDSITVSGDVATVAISTGVHASQITGVIGTGNLPITSLGGVNFVPGESDPTPAFDLSDAHSLPSGVSTTATGILTSGNSTLRLTLNGETTVDVDVSALNNVSPVSLAASTSYFYLNNGVQLANNEHNLDNGVVFYGTPVRRGQEIVFSIPGNSAHVGIWNGGVGVTGSDNVRNKSNWQVKWQYNHNRTDWEAATATHGPTGVELAKDIQVDNGTYAIRFDHTTQKLQLWEVSTSYDWLLSSSNVGVGTTSTYIYFSRGGDSTGGSYLPTVSTVRGQDFTLRSYTDSTRPGHSFYDGTKVNDVWKSNRSFKNGMKLKFTVPTSAGNQYWSTAFEGTEDLGNGENNAYTSGEMTWRLTNQETFTAHTDASMNTSYTAIDTSSTTLSLPGRNMSWRYNSNNIWDLFDEDTDEVVLTGDDVLSGDVYPYLLSVNNTEEVLSDYVQFEWEWNKAAWFMEYRDWESGHNANTYLVLSANGRALMEASDFLSTFSNGFYYLGSEIYKSTWGQKMRPGQEFVFTMPSVNQHGATKNNMKIGVLDSTHRQFTTAINFNRLGQPKEQSDQELGFTLSAGISTATECAGASMRLKYEYGTNKLVCDRVVAGLRTKIGESSTALDGNPIFITIGGDSTRLPVSTGVEVYGWEIVHEPPNYYNPWENWRIGGFPENSGVSVGIATTGNVLAWQADQAWRHKDGIPAGYKMHWLLPASHPNAQIGQWNTGNASSGLSNIENNDTYWDWSFQSNTSEEIDALKGFTFNTSNSNYSATKWTDPNPGSTKFSIRYHSNNSVDLFDESNSEVIATKDVNADGNPIYISWAGGGATSTQTAMQDDFFGGGDVGIALTTATV